MLSPEKGLSIPELLKSVEKIAFSALTLLVGRQEGHWPVKN